MNSGVMPHDIPIIPPQSPSERITMLRERYAKQFGQENSSPFFLIQVPLRVCPVGAHHDHQGGTVTGMAINRPIMLLAQQNSERSIAIHSVTFNETRRVNLEQVPEREAGNWANYLHGAIRVLRQRGHQVTQGFNAVLGDAMPIGGLSSSAAVSIGYCLALQNFHDFKLSTPEIIDSVLAIENGYLGLKNGILDQSVILSGKSQELSVINCRTNTIYTVAQDHSASPWSIFVVYSGLSRQLVSTPYNQRVQECSDAAKELLRMGNLPISENPKLGDVPRELYESRRGEISAIFQRRAAHYFDEASRVQSAIDLWKAGRIEEFGALMTASGESSIKNFESGTPVLISLYQILAGTSGVYGSRFCGGGFQGCCLALIDPRKSHDIAESVHKAFTSQHPTLADKYSLHFCESSNGPGISVLQ